MLHNFWVFFLSDSNIHNNFINLKMSPKTMSTKTATVLQIEKDKLMDKSIIIA